MPIEPPRTLLTMTLPPPSGAPKKPPRKRSPRPTRSGRKCPAMAETQRRLWSDPEHRARMTVARQRSASEPAEGPRQVHPLWRPGRDAKGRRIEALG